MMSKTFKDSGKQTTSRISIEVIANGDGTFEIIRNQQIVGTRIGEQWLDAELCGKYGFCGDELDEIMRQLSESGRASIVYR